MLLLLLTQTLLALVQGHRKTLFSHNMVQSLVSLVTYKPNSLLSLPLPGIFLYILQEPCSPHLLLQAHLLHLLPDNRFHIEIREWVVLTSDYKLFRAHMSLCLHNAAPLQGKPGNRCFLDTNLTTHTIPSQHPNTWQAPKKEPWCSTSSLLSKLQKHDGASLCLLLTSWNTSDFPPFLVFKIIK